MKIDIDRLKLLSKCERMDELKYLISLFKIKWQLYYPDLKYEERSWVSLVSKDNRKIQLNKIKENWYLSQWELTIPSIRFIQSIYKDPSILDKNNLSKYEYNIYYNDIINKINNYNEIIENIIYFKDTNEKVVIDYF